MKHALICHFSLEGNMLMLSKADFDEIVSMCVPGNNKNPAKAKRLRLFPLPQRFVHPGACCKAVRKINILAAIVMDKDVIILTDFLRMSQVHIMSSSQILQLPDIQPGSLVYPFSFPVYCFFFYTESHALTALGDPSLKAVPRWPRLDR
jgi:hypothetical protein